MEPQSVISLSSMNGVNRFLKMSIHSNLLKLIKRTDDNQTQHDDYMAEYMAKIWAKLEILDELKKNSDEAEPPGLKINFPEGDSLLDVQKDDGILTGQLKVAHTTASSTAVICEPLKEELMRFGEKGPRHVLIYAKISANTLVHPVYGIAERIDQRWAVMKDLRKSPTLAAAIQYGQRPQSVLERIAIAHHVATTIDYLHSVDVLVKHLSDSTVVLSSDKGEVIPYLTDLEKARLVWIKSSHGLNSDLTSLQFQEHSSGGEYDVRYEAPEFQKRKTQRHDVYTDVWR